MNLIGDYGSQSEDEQYNFSSKKVHINITPNVDVGELEYKQFIERQSKLDKIYNDDNKKNNHTTGNIEKFHFNDFNFQEQYNNFANLGFAFDPSSENNNRLIFKEKKFKEESKLTKAGEIINVYDKPELINATTFGKMKQDKQITKECKDDRKRNWNPTSSDFLGPWAGSIKEDEFLNPRQITEEQQQILDKIEEKRVSKLQEKAQREKFEVKSIFHGKELFDYQGRSFILPPSDLKQLEHTCYIPKKQIFNYTGHTKGVQAIRFFPKYGHFILSGSLDNQVKLWDTRSEKRVIRTYIGHTEAIRDIQFNNDGLNFLSASFDKIVHYWDTETGKVIRSFNIKKLPYCVSFNPEQQQSFLCGSSNKKIGQFDCRSGNRTLQYDEHLSSVNTVTFIDRGRKFCSTSDDKKIFIWEWGIPVVIKHVSEPDMNAITQAVMHPSNNYFIGQQSNNKIVVYDTKGGNFRGNKKKVFQGHLGAGYAIGLTFSPDGQFVASGDADGKIWFWDWKTTKNFRTIQAHDGVCMSVAWHPIEPSKFATCGWDGTIKLWD